MVRKKKPEAATSGLEKELCAQSEAQELTYFYHGF